MGDRLPPASRLPAPGRIAQPASVGYAVLDELELSSPGGPSSPPPPPGYPQQAMKPSAAATAPAAAEPSAGVPRRTVRCAGLALPFGVAVHRALVCVLAIALLWSTSLSVARSVTSAFVSAPSFGTVIAECRRTYDEVHRQRDAHVACTARQVERCDGELQRGMAVETRRSHDAALANREVVSAALRLRSSCTQHQFEALQAVQRLQAAGVPLAWRERACTDDELAAAQAAVGDISAARGAILDVANRYAEDVSLLQSDSLRSVDARMDYDRAYLAHKQASLASVPQKLNELSSEQAARLSSSLAALNGSFSVCEGACELPLQPQIERMRSQYNVLLTVLKQQRDDMGSFHDEMESMVGAIQVPLNNLKRLAASVDPGIRLPSISVPEVQLPEVHLPPLPSTAELRNDLGAYERKRQAQAQVHLRAALNTSAEWKVGVDRIGRGGMPSLLDDYEPPPVNTSAARLALGETSERFIADEGAAINSFATLPSQARGGGLNGSANGTSGVELPSFGAGAESALGLRFEPLSGTRIDVDLLSIAISNIAWIATACDFAWRAWRSAHLVIRYWSKASVGLPTLDLREGAAATAAAASTCTALGRSPGSALSGCLFSPVSGGTIVLGALLLIANAATALYVPAYLSYVTGCIEPPRNGTFLTRNLFSVGYNFAATDGNQALAKGLDSFHSTRAANCSAELRDSMRQQQSAERQLSQAMDETNSAARSVQLMRQCMAISELDAAAVTAGIAPWLPLNEVLADGACGLVEAGRPPDGIAEQLRDGVYNCSALPQCESACDGPSRDITSTLCQRCGCHGEWLLHGMVLQVGLALLVFSCLNAARVVAIDAVCRLLWRRLYAGQFEFVAACDEQGVAAVGRAEILGALRLSIGRHARSGWLLLAAAAAINVPWVLALQYVGEHLAVGLARGPG